MMNMKRALVWAAVLTMWACGAEKPGSSNDASTDGDVDAYWDGYEVPENVDDADTDAISDTDEGRSSGTDTDGDTTPDWQDTDSDGDGIDDIFEAGDALPSTPPRDSDADGTPDFRDDDSDGNGISDLDESCGTDPPCDTDSDGYFDFMDEDNDQDGLDDTVEIGAPTSPVDFDGDTVPDYLDTDSDDDTIRDLSEQTAGADRDTDGDTVVDRHDLDTDGDGWDDADEAGDTDPSTWPVDTDDDSVPDFRDPDSDADGLSDEEELVAGTRRDLGDTDGDGVNDLIEVSYGSNPLSDTDSPRTHGDFVFTVPYNDPADPPPSPLYPIPEMDTLVFSTNIQQADVFFLVDTTASMGGEIDNLVASLSTYIIPEISAEISDVWFGVAGYDDYPVLPYGIAGTDSPFYLLQRMTGVPAQAQSAVETLALHDGEDLPESTVPALWAVATGNALDTYVPAQTACAAGEFGYPCFRPGAVPIVVLITDARFHNDNMVNDPYVGVSGPPPYYLDAVTQLTARHIKVVGVYSESAAASDMEQIVRDTGAVDSFGQPLVTMIMNDGSQLGQRVVLNVMRLANQVPLEVGTEPRDVNEGPGDTVDATVFINRIVPNTAGGVEDPVSPGTFCIGGLAVGDTTIPPDGIADIFTSVLPGQSVCFDIYPELNDMVPHTTEPQIYLAEIDVVGDGITVLDTRDVYFLIPPFIENPIFE